MKKLTLIGLLLIIASGLFISSSLINNTDDQIISYKINPKSSSLKFYYKDGSGQLYSSIKNLEEKLSSSNKKLSFAMNGGMYQKDQSPLGLYIENGKVIHTLNAKSQEYGNFYMQPGGIFHLDKNNTPSITILNDFKISKNINYATQSGPMLVIDGHLHSKFIKGSSNLNIRNGVGLLPNGNLLFAISKEKINFYDFALFFKNKGCKNALYLDGFV